MQTPPIGLATPPTLMAGAPFRHSRLSSVQELLLVTDRAVLLVLGVVRLLVHGDGESHWGLGGLGIGVGRFSM